MSASGGPTTVTPQPAASLKPVDKNPPPASTIVLTASPITNNNSSSNSIVVGDLINSTSITKTETSSNSVHHNNIQQQPIDLAQNVIASGSPVVSGLRTSSSVLQLRPIGTIRSATTAAKGVPLNSVVLTNTTTNVSNHNSGTMHQPTPIISVNRTGSNLTILPAKVPFPSSNGSATLQFARGTTILRPALNASCQSGSITVTPISGSSIRLASATVNNGSWLQTSNNSHAATFTPIRPIQVTGRAIRPDVNAKVIHIPPQGAVQHLTQLQVVDGKGTAILKPHLSGAPIIRTIQTSSTSVSGAPITPSFTIRTASLPSSKSNSTPPLQKVITQSTLGPSIQLVGGPKHAIQTITPIPRLTLSNPSCLTISTSGPLNSTNPPVVAVASKGSGGTANIIMGPNAVNSLTSVPLTKIYDVPLLLAKSQTPLTSGTGSVTISVSSTNTTLANNATNAQITSTTNSPMQSTNTGIHHVVQIHGPLNGPGQTGNSSLATIGLAQANTTSNFFVGQKGVNFVQAGTTIPIRPLTIEKKQEIRPNTSKGANLIAGQMILTPSGNPPSSNSGPVAISIGPHTFAHPITIASTTQPPGITTTTSLSGQSAVSVVPTTPAGGVSTSTINVIGGQQQSLTLSGQIIPAPQNSQEVPSIPSNLSSQSSSSTPSTSSFTTVSSTTSVIVTTASVASSSNSAPLIPSISVPIISPSIIVSNPNKDGASSSSTAPAVPSPSQQTSSQSKTNLSPRPSILRKRDAPSSDNIQFRAQRNLALNFSLPNSNANSPSSATSTSSVSATISVTAAAANKENNAASTVCLPALPGNNSSSGLSLVKKDFQPPNEESSWQSCSSNSSSGSTTLSTTSETAEIQLQQSLGTTIANLTSASSTGILNASNGVSTAASTPPTVTTHSTLSSTTLNSQNGSHRPTNTPARSRLSSTSKAFNKDLDRVKGVKGKEDHVSPRKKPRKQQLPTGDPLEPASSEISFYQGKRLKRNEILDPSLFQGFPDKLIAEANRDEVLTQRVCYIIKKPHYSLLEADKLSVKSRLNHFQKYSDVKPKDEKRPSLNELANQKDVFTKIQGFKLQHLNNHIEQMIQSEVSIVSDFNSLLNKIEAKAGPNENDRDLNRLQELLKGNIQRCKVITDQMSEAKCQISRILDHKANISDILSKHVNKRPTKKRERL